MQTQAMIDLPPVVAPPPARPLMKLYPMFSMNMYAARRSGLRALRAQASRAPCAQANEPRLRPRQAGDDDEIGRPHRHRHPPQGRRRPLPVSYTHLTLPTNREV